MLGLPPIQSQIFPIARHTLFHYYYSTCITRGQSIQPRPSKRTCALACADVCTGLCKCLTQTVPMPRGGEDQLLHQLAQQQRRRQTSSTTFPHSDGVENALFASNASTAWGTEIDAATQLVVTCEMCGRPATAECYACTMQICSFCTRDRHWKVGVCLACGAMTSTARDRLWGLI